MSQPRRKPIPRQRVRRPGLARPAKRPPPPGQGGRRRPPRSSRRPPRPPSRFRWRWFILIMIFLPLGSYVSWLDIKVREQFEGKRWAVPARVYARPMELYTDMRLSPDILHKELEEIGYRRTRDPQEPGEYRRRYNDFYINARAFKFWDTNEPPRQVHLDFERNTLTRITDLERQRSVPVMRIEPKIIGKIYPTHNEDRILVQLKEVPPLLVQALVATEDRNFFEHNGISFRGIARALVANMRAGGLVQGGSTLTQQLIKNFYLSSERTFSRKINEAIMSVLLEWHYTKEQILEAYLNEVYLGQDGDRAIHGVGLASWFYFNRPLQELKLPELALIVALVRAASQYNPRRHPQRALERRNLVIDLMVEQSMITAEEGEQAKSASLGVIDEPKDSSVSPYPAFLDLVRIQLRRDYREEDLRSEGLQIFTTLDPTIQSQGERAMIDTIKSLERENRKTRELQGAMLVTGAENGEVLAMVNGRNPRYAGFNRPLNAHRQIGSLVKVAIYLSALKNTRRYSLTSVLDDSPYEWIDSRTGEVWRPKNYDHRSHGKVSLYKALANSYNLATVRLGMEVGLSKVKNTMQAMGIEREFDMFPSTLLGSVALSPLEVTQMYQTLASGGFRVPLRAIRNVLNHKGKPLNRYPLSVEQRFEPGPIFLLNYALQKAVRKGTGRKVARQLPSNMVVAGKTGTSNDLRDSWFAGFDSDLLTVVWLGRDDDHPIDLSGGSGAMVVWAEFMKTVNSKSLEPLTPSQIQWRWVDYNSGNWTREGRAGAVLMPFIVNNRLANK